MHDICFWYLPTYFTYLKILACVHDQIQRFYSNCQTSGVDVTIFWKDTQEFLNLSLSWENKLSPLEILQNCVWHPLEIPRWNWRPMETPHEFFLKLSTPGNFTFFNWPLEFPHVLFSIPLEVPRPEPPGQILSEIAGGLSRKKVNLKIDDNITTWLTKEQFKYTYWPIFKEVKAIRHLNLVSEYIMGNIFLKKSIIIWWSYFQTLF